MDVVDIALAKTYAKKMVSGMDLSGYATKDDVTQEIAKVVADAPEDFDTLKEMSDWISGHEDSAAAMNSAIKDNADKITELQTAKANTSDLQEYVKKAEADEAYQGKSDVLSELSDDGNGNLLYKDKQVEPDLSGYAKSADVTAEIETATADMATNTAVDTKLSDYATHDWVEGKHYLTEHQDLSGYATTERVDALEKSLNTLLSDNLLFDGTPERYKAAMKWWFVSNGCNALTAIGLTELCGRWYALTRTAWNGSAEFYQPDVSSVSTGTKGGDNAGLVCVPSTDTEANQDDYAGHPLFAVVDCNYIIDADTLEPVITAIDGVTGGFERYNPEKYVGVLQQSGWHWYDEKESTYIHGYSAVEQSGHDYCEPLPEAVKYSDNSMRQWVVHSKYMNKTTDGKLTSYSGPIPTAWESHNTEHSQETKNGTGYSGSCVIDYAFLQLMAFIKYGQMTLDGTLQGCVSYSYQYYAQVAETGVKRVILTTAQAANLIVGSSVLVGNYAGNADRGQAAIYSITGQAGAKITAIEDITINDTAYAAVYVDTADTFDTTANGNATEGSTIISTFHWANGSCDNILGSDGSPKSPGSGKYAARLQGIEFAVGGYECMSDVILNLYQDETDSNYYYEPYLVNLAANQSTGITDNYRATGLKSVQPSATAWLYIRKLTFASGIFFGTDTSGGSSSTYTRDAFYKNAATTGTREWLAFGNLITGVGNAGLSCLAGGGGLGAAYWYVLARLSPNGNRGEWAA